MSLRNLSFLLVAAMFFATSTPAAERLGDPASLIRGTAGEVLSKLNQRRAEFTANPALLHDVVREDLLPLMDLTYSARLILGRMGRGISAEQLDAFSRAMSDQLVLRYCAGLLQFRSEEQLQVMPLKGELNERMTRVRTRVRLKSGGFAPVDYVFHMTHEGWKIFDVIVEGISYVTTYRNQIMPEVQAEGLDAVTARLTSGDLALNK